MDVFFVLSGFLITGMLLASRDAPHRWRNFFVRRALRVLPLYYLVVLGRFAALAAGFDFAAHPREFPPTIGELAAYLTHTSNFWLAAHGADRFDAMLTVAWSLAIEEQFYLLWPVVVWTLGPRRVLLICGLAVITCPILRVLTESQFGPYAAYLTTPCRADGLAAGAAVATLTQGGVSRRWLAIGLLLAAAGAVVYTAAVIWQRGFLFTGIPILGVGLSGVVLATAGLITGIVSAPAASAFRPLTSRPLRAAGKYSFAAYLFNDPICATVGWLLAPTINATPFPVGMGLHLGLSVTVTFALAWVSWRLIESPANRLKRYFPIAPPVGVHPEAAHITPG